MRYTVAIPCYNSLPALEQCLDAALAYSPDDAEFFLVNNHPPYPEVAAFLSSPIHPRVQVLDPGRNLGCHRGQEYGLQQGTGKYTVKLDDDIVVGPDWLERMSQALEEHPDLAYAALPWHGIPPFKADIRLGDGYCLGIAAHHLFFGCVMLPRDLWQAHFVFPQDHLYGWEESFYHRKAQELGKTGAYLLSHPCVHLARSASTNPTYGVWKVLYAFLHTRVPFDQWRLGGPISEGDKAFLLQWGYKAPQLEQVQQELADLHQPCATPPGAGS